MEVIAKKNGKFAIEPGKRGFIALVEGKRVEIDIPNKLLEQMIKTGWVEVVEEKAPVTKMETKEAETVETVEADKTEKPKKRSRKKKA